MRTVEEIDRDIEIGHKLLEHVKGSECEVYSRIVGYHRALKNWNDGKRAEYSIRKPFDIELSMKSLDKKAQT